MAEKYLTFSKGYFVSSFSATPEIALSAAIPMALPLAILGGFFAQNGSAPAYVNWLSFLSWFMYGYEALSINQWYGVEFNNTNCQYIGYNVSALIELVPPIAPEPVFNLVEFITGLYTAYESNVVCSGDDILEFYNFNPVCTIVLFI